MKVKKMNRSKNTMFHFILIILPETLNQKTLPEIIGTLYICCLVEYQFEIMSGTVRINIVHYQRDHFFHRLSD